MIRIVAALLLVLFSTSISEARRLRTHVAADGCNVIFPCEGVTTSKRGEMVVRAMGGFGVARKVYTSHHATMLPHPSGCPRRAFCGCGAAVEVFGAPRRALWLAANWLRFPRTSPAPGMVAARAGHVFVLKQQLADGLWLVADYNSGGHQSRLHARSLSGYAIVNPRA